MTRRLVRTATAALFLLLVGLGHADTAWSQAVTTAAIRGRVTTTSGQPVQNAQVTVRNTATGYQTGSLTNEDGLYFVPHLQVGGPYHVRVQHIGYKPEEHGNLTLNLGQAAQVDFELEQQAVQVQGIEVTAQGNEVFSKEHTGQQTTVTQNEISHIPTVSRNFQDFATLSPLAVVDEGSEGVSIAGQNNRYNNIQIDGAVNNDVFGLASSGVPGGQANAKPISLDAIKEFQVLVAPFDVRQSGFSGGQINAVTKSGTNEFHGNAFGYYENDSFVGDLNGQPFGDFTDSQFGFSLGGPIQTDKLHFFVNGEFEIKNRPNPSPAVGTDPVSQTGVAPDSAQRFVDILSNTYNVDPGTVGTFTVKNPRTNLFARLDWKLNDHNRLTLRHNLSHATDGSTAGRGGFYYDLSSYTYNFKSTTNSTVAELFSQFGDWSNELLGSAQFIRDDRNPSVNYPLVEVNVASTIDGQPVYRRLSAGAEPYSQANALDQNIFELTDNLSRSYGDHRITLGTHNEFFHFRNVFIPYSLGQYRFGSLADLQANQPDFYDITLPYPGLTANDITAKWSALEVGGYAQDQWTVSPQLSVTLGLRLDVPFVLDDPRANPDFQNAFGFSTANAPSGNLLWSPRIGFNWRSKGDELTQVRGGVGVFSGRPPFVWISNIFSNTGRETVSLFCPSSIAPGFDPTQPSPAECTDGTGASAGGPAIVNVFSNDFKFPQQFKASLGMDHQLPGGFSATAEGLFTKSLNQIFFEEYNLAGQQSSVGPRTGIGNRPIYGTPTADGFAPVRKSAQFAQVVRGVNTSDNYAVSFTGEIKKTFSERFSARASYTYSHAEDTQSLTSSIATSNYGFNPIRGNPNNPERTVSDFDRPNRVVASGTARVWKHQGFTTDVTFFYVGQSGRPYSYVYGSDVNGDGYPGSGPVSGRTNDLVYVPSSASDIVFANSGDYAKLQDLMSVESCLRDAAGTILKRNSCRAPWTNRLDMNITQGFPGGWGRGHFKLELDVFNVLNLLNSDWGRVERYPYNTVTLLELDSQARVNGDPNQPLQFDYVGPLRDSQTGDFNRFVTYSPASQWQLKLGLRYEF